MAVEKGKITHSPAGEMYINLCSRIWSKFRENGVFRWIVVVVQWLSHVQLFATPWTAACQASLSFTISQSLPKLMSTESVMPSNHLILCHPFLLLSVFPSNRVFANESTLHIQWPKYQSVSFSISLLMNIQGQFPLGLTDLISLLAKDSQKSLL